MVQRRAPASPPSTALATVPSHHRGGRSNAGGESAAAGLARSRGGAMRLLPVRADHVGSGAAEGDAEAQRRPYRRRHVRQCLPLRHVSAHSRRDPPRRSLSDDMTMPHSSLARDLDRRGFLKGGAASGVGLVVTLTLAGEPLPAWGQAESSASFAPNAFIRIDRRGAVTLVMPMVEMGQGTYTSLAMLLAEELEVGLDQVKLEHAPPNDALYANALLQAGAVPHPQRTGLSASIRAFWTPLRQAGAVARTLLIAAAAKEWGVDPVVC